MGKPEPFSSFICMACFFIPQLPAFSSTLWGFPVINYGLGGLWPFAVLQLWWPLSCWNICVLVWKFSLVSLVPSSLLTLLSFWNSCLDFGPQNCSSYFIFFTFLLFLFSTFGEFSCIFLLLYCCVCGWMGVIVLPSSATTLRVLLCAPSECMLLLRQCCSVVLMIEFFSLCIYQFSWSSFFVFAIFFR